MKKRLSLFGLALLSLVLSSCNMGAVKVAGKIDSREINLNLGMIDLPHTGERKILVIPVDFVDYPAALLGPSALSSASIDAVFFGETAETGWESVSSFYSKSSYGKLKISGQVSSWFRAPQSASYYSALAYRTSSKEVTDNLAYEALTYVQNNCPEIDLGEYDTDQDGNVDAVWLVYSRPYETSSDLWWAYTTWSSIERQPKLGDSPKAVTYSWASYDFIYSESHYRLPDAHTFIHETGHLLGLDDYYDVDNTSNPTGSLAMMDCNIGDHEAFSKYLLDWIEPTVAESSVTSYTLRPFESSGDALLIPITYAGNPYGEYLLLEYYTPTGLNEQDSSTVYEPNGLQMFTEPGILCYHVDNRLGKFTYNPARGQTWNGRYYTDIDFYRSNLYSFVPVNSNTPSYSYARDPSQKLLALVSPLDRNLKESDQRIQPATDADLFQLGDSFQATGKTTNSGEPIPFSFTVAELDGAKAVITIA